MSAARFAIRPARPDDEPALVDICVRTARAGADGSADYGDRRMPGLIWAVPYLRFRPAHALVLTRDGAVAGYAVGAPDTAGFEAELEAAWWPDVRRAFAGRPPAAPLDAGILAYIDAPERMPAAIAAAYPAHLHINLLPEARGGGRGSRLVAALLDGFAARGVGGVHLGINPGNAGVAAFYARLGFCEIARLPSIIMARTLP